MASTAGAKAAGKRSWQQAERRVFDERSHKVWRAIVSILVLSLLCAAGYYVWLLFRTPPKTLLLTITDDRTEYATVPPVPMLPGDEQALLGWAKSAKVPTILRKLPVVKDIGSFIDSLTSTDPTRPKFELLTAEPSLEGKDFPLRPNDKLIVYIRAHGMAAPALAGQKPQPFLVTKFDGFQELSDQNAISVKDLLERLAAIPKVNKLVILDAVHFNYDPRLGQLINQFPDAVANVIPADAENLWVILPTASGEQTAFVPHHERTIFNIALVDALQAENYKGAKHVVLTDLVTKMRSRYFEMVNTEVDLEFWQTLTQRPSLEDPQVAKRFERAGAQILIPTAPIPKKTAEQKAADAAADKKTAATFRPVGQLENAMSLSLAAYQPPAASPPATPPLDPAKSAAGTPAPSSPPTGAPANPPAPMPMNPAAPGTTGAPEVLPPKAKPNSAPPAAEDPNAEAKHKPSIASYQKKIAEAWRLRDELEQWEVAGGVGWSPVHFAPHHWRRLNAHLVSHEERCRAGELKNSEKDLTDLISYLQSLQTTLQSKQSAGASDRDQAFDLAGSWQRFKFGEGKGPSLAWKSFESSETNALQPANRALKHYADCAYRLPEYVHLQGLLMTAADVQLKIDPEVDALIDWLNRVRREFSQFHTDGRIDRTTAGDLEILTQSLLGARRQVDGKIKRLAGELAEAQAIASPGRAQAICLLLQSPLLPADQRIALLERVLPPSTASTPNPTRRVGGITGGSGAQVLDELPTQVRREIKVIEFFSGQGPTPTGAQPTGALLSSATSSLKNLRDLIKPSADKATNALPLGEEFRQFFSQLPQQIKAQQSAPRGKKDPTAREIARETFELYHWLLLVDGRDAGELNQLPVFLIQPFQREFVPDLIKLSLSPTVLQLTDKPQYLEVTVELVTEKADAKDLEALLSLQFDANALEVVDVKEESAVHVNRKIGLPGKIWIGKFRVTSRDPGGRQSVPLTATVKFAQAVAPPQSAEIRLPRPNLVDLTVVAEHRWRREEPLANAEIERDQGAELRLYPNRETALKLQLRNLSSEKKTVRVWLVRPPDNLIERGRLYEEGGSLRDNLRPLETQIGTLKNDELPPTLAGRVVAATPQKSPIELPPNGSESVDVKLELLPPPGAAAGAPAATFDVTGGLICIITNVVENKSERFVKWLDLRPYAPDELYKVENFAVVGQDLSFQVRLLSKDLAEGMRLDVDPLMVVWDRDGTSLGKQSRYDVELNPMSLVANFRGPIPTAARRNVVIRLHVDGYPRAFLYNLQLDETKVISEHNLKQDRILGVHVSRLAFEKQVFHILRPNWVFQPVVEPPPVPPAEEIIPQVLIRSSKHPVAGIKLDNRQPRQTLTYDLQADVASAAFSNGAVIEIAAQDGQEPKRLYSDRDVRIKLLSATDKGVLTFATKVDDFHNLPIVVDTEPNADTQVTLTAALRGNSDLTSPDGLHSLPIIFDRLRPEIRGATLGAKEIQARDDDLKGATPVVVRMRVTDNMGVGVKRVQAALVPRGGPPVELKPGDTNVVEFNNPPGSEIQLELPVPLDLEPKVHNFQVQIEPVDRVDRVGTKTMLDVAINVQKVEPGARGTLRPSFSKEANERAKDLKEKAKLKAQQEALQPPAGGAGT